MAVPLVNWYPPSSGVGAYPQPQLYDQLRLVVPCVTMDSLGAQSLTSVNQNDTSAMDDNIAALRYYIDSVWKGNDVGGGNVIYEKRPLDFQGKLYHIRETLRICPSFNEVTIGIGQGSISGTALTINSLTSGRFRIGQLVTGPGVPGNLFITAGPTLGLAGTYTLGTSGGTVTGPIEITGTFPQSTWYPTYLAADAANPGDIGVAGNYSGHVGSLKFVGGGGGSGDPRGLVEYESPFNYDNFGDGGGPTGGLVWQGGQSGPMIDFYSGGLFFDNFTLIGDCSNNRSTLLGYDPASEWAARENYCTCAILMHEYSSGIGFLNLGFACFRTGIQLGEYYNRGDNADQLRGNMLTGAWCDRLVDMQNVQSVSHSIQSIISFHCGSVFYGSSGGKIIVDEILIIDPGNNNRRCVVFDLDGMSRNHMNICVNHLTIDGNAHDTEVLDVRGHTCAVYLNLKNLSADKNCKRRLFTMRDSTNVRLEAASLLRRGQLVVYDGYSGDGRGGVSGYTGCFMLRDSVFDDNLLSASVGPLLLFDAENSRSGNGFGGGYTCVFDWSGCRAFGGAFTGLSPTIAGGYTWSRIDTLSPTVLSYLEMEPSFALTPPSFA